MEIPLFVTQAALEPLLPRIVERQRAVLESGRYILGPEVEAFESEFAAFVGARHCIGVANGTDALTIALRALGVKHGDEVVVPSLTFYATAEAVVNAGATPVFADVDPQTWCVSAATVEPALSDRTSAVIPVHLFGNPAPMEELMKLASARGIRVLEDAAQGAGAKLGSRFAGALGHAATFSFFPSKNLPGTGDGGAITTDDDEVAAMARRLRFHGSEDKLTHTEVGYNSRLDELQAAGLRVALEDLETWTRRRRQAAAAYAAAGLGEVVQLPFEADSAQSCFHLYVVRSSDRDRILAALSTAGIGSRSYYTTPVHRQPAMAPYAATTELGETDRFAAENLAIPMGPGLDEDAVATVVATVRQALTG